MNMHPQSASPARSIGEATRRRRQFEEEYGDGQEVSNAICHALENAREALWYAAGDKTDIAFDVLIAALFRVKPERSSWRDVLHRNAHRIHQQMPTAEDFRMLHAYAHYGIALNGGEAADGREYLLDRVLWSTPLFCHSFAFKGDLLTRLVLLGGGRYNLDHGEPVDPEALALFGGIEPGRIREMMPLSVFDDVNGCVPADQALEWLHRRPEHFRSSIWQEQDTFENLPSIGIQA